MHVTMLLIWHEIYAKCFHPKRRARNENAKH